MDLLPAPPDTDHNDISRAELEALVDDVLTLQEATLWRLMHGPEAGRTHLSTLVLRAFPDTIKSNAECSKIAREVVGKVESRGVPRARAFQVMTGFNRDRVSVLLAQFADDPDPKIALKALDISARCLGMGTASPQVTVNVGVQVLSGRVGSLLADALSEDVAPAPSIDTTATPVSE